MKEETFYTRNGWKNIERKNEGQICIFKQPFSEHFQLAADRTGHLTALVGSRYTLEGVFTGGLGIEVYILVTGGCGEGKHAFCPSVTVCTHVWSIVEDEWPNHTAVEI